MQQVADAPKPKYNSKSADNPFDLGFKYDSKADPKPVYTQYTIAVQSQL